METTRKRVAVIGAGMCGMKALKEMVAAGFDTTCFELSEDIGGIWRFTEEESLSSVYRSTRINTLRAGNSFADFPIPESYPLAMDHNDVMRYFRAYVNQFDLLQYIKFNTKVLTIEPFKARQGNKDWSWRIVTEPTDGEGEPTETIFDGVVVCSGHHSKPHKFPFKGLETFPGIQMHSHSYKDNSKFVGKRCVVVGIGNSGSDVVTEIAKVASRTVLVARRGSWIIPNPFIDPQSDVVSRFDQNILGRISQRAQAHLVESQRQEAYNKLKKANLNPTYGFNEAHPTLTNNSPDNNFYEQLDAGRIEGRRGIDRFEGSNVYFTDGTSMEADAVVFCTGYKLTYPFLSSQILETNDANEIELYKYMFPVGDKQVDNIAFIGVVQPVGPMAMIADVQTRVVAQYLKGKVPLPSREVMKTDIRQKREFNLNWYYRAPRHTIQVSMRPYLDEIGEMIGCTPTFFRLLFKAPWLLYAAYRTPTMGAHYRLVGYGANQNLATYDLAKERQACFSHMRNRKTLLGFILYYIKLYGMIFPMAVFYQLKSLLTTGKTFFFLWD